MEKYLITKKLNNNFFADTVNLNYDIRKANRYNKSIEEKLQVTLWDKIDTDELMKLIKEMQTK
jgi:hypothetical protein